MIKIIKEKLGDIQELTDEVNHNDLKIILMILKNGVEMKSGEMKLEDAKEMQSISKTNLNKMAKRRFKSEGQKNALENIKLLQKYDNLLLNYLMIIL